MGGIHKGRIGGGIKLSFERRKGGAQKPEKNDEGMLGGKAPQQEQQLSWKFQKTGSKAAMWRHHCRGQSNERSR